MELIYGTQFFVGLGFLMFNRLRFHNAHLRSVRFHRFYSGLQYFPAGCAHDNGKPVFAPFRNTPISFTTTESAVHTFMGLPSRLCSSVVYIAVMVNFRYYTEQKKEVFVWLGDICAPIRVKMSRQYSVQQQSCYIA